MSVQLAFEESKIKRRLIETDIKWKREEICEAGIELSIKRDLFNNKILRKHICKFLKFICWVGLQQSGDGVDTFMILYGMRETFQGVHEAQ